MADGTAPASRPPSPPVRAVTAGAGPSPLCTAGALLGAFGLAWFVLSTLAVHLLRPDLDAVDSQMSLYLFGPWGHLLQLAYAVLAVSMAGLFAGLRAAMPPGRRRWWPLVLMVLAGLCLCTAAFERMDPPGVAAPSVRGTVHWVSAQAAFVLGILAMLLQSWSLVRQRLWPRASFGLLVWAHVCVPTTALLAIPGVPMGLTQKAIIGVFLVWLVAADLALWRYAGPGRRARPRAMGNAVDARLPQPRC